MNDAARIGAGIRALAVLAGEVASATAVLTPIVAAMRKCLAGGGTLFFAGNGGSAADAQHVASEYVIQYRQGRNQRALRAVALTTDTSALTAAANDLGYDQVFARQLDALSRPGDVLIVHSTSGVSPNCVAVVKRAKAIGVVAIGFLGGSGGDLKGLVDHAFIVPDDRTNYIQEIHLAVQHQIAAILTEEAGG